MSLENIIQASIFILVNLASLLLGAILEAVYQPVRTRLRLRRLYQRISDRQAAVVPVPFIPPTVSHEGSRTPSELSGLAALQRQIRGAVSSRTNALLIAGSFGVGKTFLARHLVSLGRRAFLGLRPLYLDASRFKSENVFQEIKSQFEVLYGLELAPGDLSLLLSSRSTLLILDGLDQIPSASTRSLVLSGVLTYVEYNHIKQKNTATVVLVLRTEFLNTDSRLKRLRSAHCLPVLVVRGLPSAPQRRAFFQAYARLRGDAELEDRIAKVESLCSARDDLLDLLSRPLLLSRMRAIEVERIRDIAPSGVPLARAFRLSFEKISPAARQFCSELGWWLYCRDSTNAPQDLRLPGGEEPSGSEAFAELLEAGILTVAGGEVSFGHLTFRDYFAAEKIVAMIGRQQVEEALGGRLIHYLVSELVAGLLSVSDLMVLLNTLEDLPQEGFTRRNGFDILTEVKDGESLEIATEFVKRCLDSFNFESPEFDEFKTFMATTGAVYGRLDAARYVVTQLETLGVEEFQKVWFYSSQAHSYYGGLIDVALDEWLDQLRTRKHCYFRVITMEYMGAIGYRAALNVLEEIAGEGEEETRIEDDEAPIRETARKVAKVLRSKG